MDTNFNDNEDVFYVWVIKMKLDYPFTDSSVCSGWRRIDEEWLVSARDNGTYKQKAFHICPESHMRTDTIINLDDLCPCGAEIPEGVRMVALLLEAL